MWNWTLTRQGLHPATRLATVAEIAAAALGLHAARLPGPYATALARAKSPRPTTGPSSSSWPLPGTRSPWSASR